MLRRACCRVEPGVLLMKVLQHARLKAATPPPQPSVAEKGVDEGLGVEGGEVVGAFA
jgi:hypothetical protein